MFKEMFFGGAGVGAFSADLVLMMLRAFSGIALAMLHGWGKFQDPNKMIGAAEGMGLPAPTVFGWAATITEFFLAILMALGLFTRISALMVCGMMATAAFVVHKGQDLANRELALLYMAISLVFVVIGSGRFGADALIRKKIGRSGAK